MKYLKYKLLQSVLESGEQVFAEKLIEFSEAGEELAKREAHDGEYVFVEDDTEENRELTQEERIAELEEGFEMMLSGVTE